MSPSSIKVAPSPGSPDNRPWVVSPLPAWQSYGDGPSVCIGPDCSKAVLKRGLCRAHYSRWWKLTKGLSSGPVGPPDRGGGVVCCAMCDRPLRDHKLTETCLPGPMARIV